MCRIPNRINDMRQDKPTDGTGNGASGAPDYARGQLQGMERALKAADDNRYPIDKSIREEAIELARHLMHCSNPRVQVAALRVLLLADQVNVRRERNEIAEEGTALAASTARLRVALGSQEGREALAAVTAAVCGPSKTPMNPPVLDDSQQKEHTDVSVCSPEPNGIETVEYASFGGPRYKKENATGELPKPQ